MPRSPRSQSNQAPSYHQAAQPTALLQPFKQLEVTEVTEAAATTAVREAHLAAGGTTTADAVQRNKKWRHTTEHCHQNFQTNCRRLMRSTDQSSVRLTSKWRRLANNASQERTLNETSSDNLTNGDAEVLLCLENA